MMSVCRRFRRHLFLLLFLGPVPVALPARGASEGVPVRHLTVRELWRLPAEDDTYLVSTLTDARFDPRGDLCIADVKQKCVFVFGRDGTFLRTLGREGEGPGESRDVRCVFFADDRYGLLQLMPAAIVWLNSDGTPAGKVTIASDAAGGESWVAVGWARQDGAHILAWINRSSFQDGKVVRGDEGLVEVASDGSVGPLLFRQPPVPDSSRADGIDEGRIHDIWMGRWCGDGHGGVWVAPERDRYLLQHWGPGSGLLTEVELPYEAIVRNEAGRERVLERLTGRGFKRDQVRVAGTAPVIADLRLGDGRKLWARLDLGGNILDGDVNRVYDVFDNDGRRLEQVHVHGGADAAVRLVIDDRTMVSLIDDPQGDRQWLVLETLESRAGSAH